MKVKQQLSKIFARTIFRDAPMIEVSAKVGGEKVAAVGGGKGKKGKGGKGGKGGNNDVEEDRRLLMLLDRIVLLRGVLRDCVFHFAMSTATKLLCTRCTMVMMMILDMVMVVHPNVLIAPTSVSFSDRSSYIIEI